ncbi:MAG: acetylxylan esterase [Planctomycetaceae bacterium]|nr:acetylxylan esterase [Planctomycetaceae bacterium]
MNRILLCLTCLFSSASVSAEDLSVLPKPEPGKKVTYLQDAFRPLVHEALDRRLKEREALQTPEQIAEWQRKLRGKFIQSLGGFPERTPLNANIVGTIDEPDYRLEKVIYESRPQFYVTANLYLPKTAGPHPAVLVPCGHSANGKAYESYQRICIMFAKHGMAAFCYDPPGQGERNQILEQDDDHHATAPFKATAEHNVTGVAPVLLGENLATYFIWDGMRGLDYLQSRDDIDGDRLGCTGNSGGGMMTSYLMALDDRIKAASPGCFITTTRIKNERPGPGDAEQNIFAQTAYGLDHADFIMLAAPRAVLISSATHDFVPIEGAWESYRQAKRLYTKLGISERVSLVEADEKHGFTKPLRIAVTQWMQRWLLDIDKPVTEHEFAVHTDAELQCTPHGQVLLLEGAKSVFDLYREKLALFINKRKLPQTEKEKAVFRVRWQLEGEREFPSSRSEYPVTVYQTIDRSDYSIEKLSFNNAWGIPIPMLYFQPTKITQPAILYVNGEGKSEGVSSEEIQESIRAGHPVLAVDLSGYGETESTPWRFSETYSGPNAAAYYNMYMMGISLVEIRTGDLLIASRYLRKAMPELSRVELVAVKDATVLALHAAALEPELFSTVKLRNGLRSWRDVVETEVTIDQLENTMHGALRSYDLPDLIQLIGADKVTVIDPYGADGKPIEK